ncbi:MAG: type II toxin-antitoxin system VapC family toxin [Victivallales bacterium]|nr:type II toxin-antitoxin system VapC family toxin [Victivallales bacterium]
MLDTDISSYIIRGTEKQLLDIFSCNLDNICVSVITLAELQYGALKRNNSQLTAKVNSFCALVQQIEWNYDSAKAYARLRTMLEDRGNLIGSMDMMIAASALAEDVILVTNNVRHFSRVDGLRIENWLESFFQR